MNSEDAHGGTPGPELPIRMLPTVPQDLYNTRDPLYFAPSGEPTLAQRDLVTDFREWHDWEEIQAQLGLTPEQIATARDDLEQYIGRTRVEAIDDAIEHGELNVPRQRLRRENGGQD